ncbi:MAG: TIGR00269 family protein [Candidatus Methanomethylophilaceae archaeon]
MKCDLCSSEAVTFVAYNGSHLCGEHLMKYVEKRVKKEIRKEIDVRSGDTIAVAVSGGKDSMVTLHILNDVFGRRPDVKLHVVTIDEGIGGYRPPSVEIVKEYCTAHDIPLSIRSFSEFGLTMDSVSSVAGENSPCTYCGVFRRKLMNDEAREMGARFLATGHNLDDMAQSIMMDFARGDVERLARLGPHERTKTGLIPRFHPLRTIPESESLLYAIVAGIPFWDGECPYWTEALRNQYRDTIDNLEYRTPGIKFSILASYDEIKPMLYEKYPSVELNTCTCGEPCVGGICKACEYEKMLKRRISDL